MKTLTTLALAVPLLSLALGCSSAHLGRLGNPVQLPTGAPRSECEQESWYEIVPTRVRATGRTNEVLFSTYYWREDEGMAIYRVGRERPQKLDNVWSVIGDPELQREHEARIEPIVAAERRVLWWTLGGVGGLAIGTGTGLALMDESRDAAIGAMLAGLAVGVVGLVGALVNQPSGEEQLYADTRRTLLIPEEDAIYRAEAGIDRANARQRQRCGGAPTSATTGHTLSIAPPRTDASNLP